MDSAHLTKAHDFARTAVTQTQKSNHQAATEQHELAAGEFAQARNQTHESEALRILNLLEQHHQSLARALRSPPLPQHQDGNLTSAETKETAADVKSGKESTRTSKSERDLDSPTQLRRNAYREMSSSIANDLAARRGKPPSRPSLLSRAETQPPQALKVAANADKPSHVPPRLVRSSSSRDANTGSKGDIAADDGNFSRFMNQFGGVFSKLPAALAFAGLPLTAESAVEEAQKIEQKEKAERRNAKDAPTRVRASDTDPDLAQIYSKAAFRVIKEEGGTLGIQDSFYWVPPSGGTVSYANVLTSSGVVGEGGTDRTPGEKRHHATLARQGSSNIPETIGEEDVENEFVDAREEQGSFASNGPPSPNRSRHKGSMTRSSGRSGYGRVVSGGGGKTMEELELENTALRQLLDTQSRRLQIWEMNSQSQGHAMAQSMRADRARSPTNVRTKHTSQDSKESKTEALPNVKVDTDVTRERDLEDQLHAALVDRDSLLHQLDKQERVNEQQLALIGRYRAKWEELKAGARKKLDSRVAGASDVGTGDGVE